MTTYRADPNLLTEINKYGNIGIEECFNCGNCTAICPLSTDQESFPRRIIRSAQLGLRDQILSSDSIWLCYYCGECTDTCPRQADPGEFMATARRYAIASYDRLGIARMLYTSPALSVVFMALLAVILSLFLYSRNGGTPTDSLQLFEFIPVNLIHNLGIAAMIFVALAGLLSIASMIKHILPKRKETIQASKRNWLKALWKAVGLEVLAQKRYREDCEEDSTDSEKPFFLQKWFIHASIMWGFLGLLAATGLDFLLEIIHIKPSGTFVPIWYPIRLLGTIAGLFLVYGSTFAIVRRFQKKYTAYATSLLSDWIFLILIWLAGVTGFLLEIAVYLPQAPVWAYWMLIVHIVIAMELLLLIPFTKFAHAIYRTAALYVFELETLNA